MRLIHWLLIFAHFILAPIAGIHALIQKRDSRAAFGWITVCIFFPLIGPVFYFLFGINRIHTRARRLGGRSPFSLGLSRIDRDNPVEPINAVQGMPGEYSELALISEKVTMRSVLGGNRLEILHNGEHAYPAMLRAIEASRKTLFLSTYIFDTNATGRQFIDALVKASMRGVDVKVMIDGMGEKYSFPRAGGLLEKKGVHVIRFLPPRFLPPSVFVNLRNHRKIMVSDGEVAFCGGMNIGDRHLAGNLDNPSRVTDVHFRIEGPTANQLQQIFLETWAFCLGKKIEFTSNEKSQGTREAALCRTIIDGPDEDIDKFANVLAGAISAARQKILIMTPYFLPSREVVAALQGAALRGVEVLIILPSRNNLPIVHWATRNMLWELLKFGVRFLYQPAPFCHSKLFVVDDHYSLIGSANLDSRSLRLNFELVVEVFDTQFSGDLSSHFNEILEKSRDVTLEEVDGRGMPARIRDALCWLFSPYL